jgi:hypothetical protein
VLTTLVLAAALVQGPAQTAAIPSAQAPAIAQYATILTSDIASNQLYQEVAKKPKKKRSAAKKPASPKKTTPSSLS